MEPVDSHIKDLFHKYLAGTITAEKLDELLSYFDMEEHSEQLKSLIFAQLEKEKPSLITEDRVDRIAECVDESVRQHIKVNRNIRTLSYRWIAVAAAAVVIVIAGLFYRSKDSKEATSVITQNEEILPGTNRATLIIEGGTPIQLTETQTTLRNTGDTIYYGDNESIPVSATVQWATLTTPRAGQYQLVLEDGTKVWLNAASKIKYPTKFKGKERHIYISGEVYLEVAHLDGRRPFIVETETQTIRVLGTKFNVEAYPDTEVQATTLVEGKVEVSAVKGSDVRILHPGQQVRVTSAGISAITEVDTQDYIAWIDGFIALNSVNLSQVARQLERWYDVNFETIPETLGRKKVFGSLKRDLPLKDVLSALESNYNVKFTINERRVSIIEK